MPPFVSYVELFFYLGVTCSTLGLLSSLPTVIVFYFMKPNPLSTLGSFSIEALPSSMNLIILFVERTLLLMFVPALDSLDEVVDMRPMFFGVTLPYELLSPTLLP